MSLSAQVFVEPPIAGAVPALELTASATIWRLNVEDVPGATAYTYLSSRPVVTSIGGLGLALIDPNAALGPIVQPLDGQGRSSLTFAPPLLPPGTVVYGQAAIVRPGGQALLSNRIGGFEPNLRPVFANRTLVHGWTDRPQSLSVGYIDSDGQLDVAYANTGFDGVHVYTNLGVGSYGVEFGLSVVPPIGTFAPQDVALGDFNGDGMIDAACTLPGSNQVEIALQDSAGFGGWSGRPSVTVFGSPWNLVPADVNSDGNLDLVVTQRVGNSVSVLIGDGLGGFSAGPTLFTGAGPGGLAVADINGDTNPDIVVANTASNSLSIFLSTGTAVFAGGVNIPLTSSPRRCAIGDLDSSGTQDLVVATEDGTVVLMGQGGGAFFPPQLNTGSGAVAAVAIGDVDHDGDLDVAVAGGDAATVFVGDGTGALGPPEVLNIGGGFSDLALGDFNLDGEVDLVLASPDKDGLTFVMGRAGRVFPTALETAIPGGEFESADLNADGILDVVTKQPNAVLLGTFGGSFQSPDPIAVAAEVIFDVDADGALDIVGANGSNIEILYGDGTGSFPGPVQSVATGGLIYSLAAGDVTRDGIPEIVVGGETINGGPSALRIHVGQVARSFGPALPINLNPLPVTIPDVLVGDWNQDGLNDILVAAGTVHVILNSATGQLQPPTSFFAGYLPQDLELADVTGDGVPELLVANAGDPGESDVEEVTVHERTPTGVTRTVLQAGVWPWLVKSGDINHDGHADIVCFNRGAGDLSVFLGTGSGVFGPELRHAAPYGGDGFVLSDFNADGFLDILLGTAGNTFLLDNQSINH